MTRQIRTAAGYLVRFALLWFVDALSLVFTSWIVPGVNITAVTLDNGATSGILTVAVGAAFLLTVVNFLIRPVVFAVARPLGWVALFIIGFFVNAAALWVTAWLMPGFTVDLVGSLLGGIFLAFFNSIITGILDVDQDGSWYQNRIEQRAREAPYAGATETGRGLMLLEIDGLSYWHIRKAIDAGLLPTLAKMVKEEGYVLSRVDCGLPSMTSSCQAGIMFGENDDIPAYRWYDKSKQKLYVSAPDATELNARYAHGQGLMRQGSSIMNMMAGDAEKSLFTMANMWGGSDEEKDRRAADVGLLMLNPYFLANIIVLFVAETVRELREALTQAVKHVEPRLNRLEHWYPFVRAAMCGPMRDISANVAVLDMLRGAPAIYMLYLGYDEVAHHSGPWTSDAFGDLQRLDKTFARLRRVIAEKSPRPYSLIILSDHGQSFGATFKQRYGVTIKEFIEQQLPQGTTVAQAIGGDTGAMGLHGVAGELANVQQHGKGRRLTRGLARGVAKGGERLAAKGAGAEAKALQAAGAARASVTAYGSGNAAQVYFDLYPRKITLNELDEAYPGMVDALVEHEGLGMVIGYADDMTAVVLGKGGSRNLHTGEVEGEDPVAAYAPAEGPGAATLDNRIWQLRRVMDFPSAGDLWLISTIYPDGTVAALEELVGSHGGVGGEQTDAFLFHPPDLVVPETRCSTDVFHILDAHRNTPVPHGGPTGAPGAAGEDESSWAPRTILRGLARPRAWLPVALRCLILDPRAYAHVAKDAYMTGPALLILLVSMLAGFAPLLTQVPVTQSRAASGLLPGLPQIMQALVVVSIVLVIWLVDAFVIFATGRLLARYGTFTRTFRALAFGQVVAVLNLFAFYVPLAGLVRFGVYVMSLLAVWVGASAAHKLRGWRAALFPLIALLVYILGAVIVTALFGGAQFTVQALLANFGLTPQ